MGPVLLTIPSYFTFTIAEKTYYENTTVEPTDLNLKNALQENSNQAWQMADGNWTMNTSNTIYYVYYR